MIFIIPLITDKIFGNIAGIYENGIIDDSKDFIEWKDIHSYSIIENNLSGYFKKGDFFVYKNIENIDKIKELFIKNKIIQREE